MKLTPRHDGPPVLVDRHAAPDLDRLLVGQRTRLADRVRSLEPADWAAPSRCAGWSVRDVAAHLVTVNGYWTASVRAALDGAPLRLLTRFDPVATPPLLLLSMESHAPAEVLALLDESNAALAEAVGAIGDAWDRIAETPVGHVSLAEMAAHALWDAWVHERDIAVPLGLAPVDDPGELRACLRYVAGLTAALTVLHDLGPLDALAIDASAPDARFVVDVSAADGLAQVVVADASPDDRPVLAGPAVELLEWLSLRAPLAGDAPAAWRTRRDTLVTVFAT